MTGVDDLALEGIAGYVGSGTAKDATSKQPRSQLLHTGLENQAIRERTHQAIYFKPVSPLSKELIDTLDTEGGTPVIEDKTPDPVAAPVVAPVDTPVVAPVTLPAVAHFVVGAPVARIDDLAHLDLP
ncbi:MAG: hypothetical protein Q9168_001685 [Polycauliona sp. 1 TL-2023]